MMLIADEVHNYGADRTFRGLPKNASLRIGLSATPERWMDENGTAALHAYFGASVFHYGLREALNDDVLTPYRYHPQLVEMDPEETEEYLWLTTLLARYQGKDEGDARNEAVKRLLIKRARLVATVRSKIPRLKDLLSQRRAEKHILVYCGDGRVETPAGSETVRQVEEVVRVISKELSMTCASYTSETPPDKRRERLDDLSGGVIQVLVAIRCLDEGVDIPATRVAYLLASSTNPRQFVQRRGRVLRRSPGKRRAEIYDFFVAPPVGDYDDESVERRIMRRMVAGQLLRAREFAGLAENGPVARSALLDVRAKLNLLADEFEEKA